MAADRRRLLLALGSSALAAPSLVACAGAARRLSGEGRPIAALLLPLTGPDAEVGLSMERAARLAQGVGDESLVLVDIAALGAAAATARAVARRVPLVLGPLFARDVAAVVAAAGGIPVLSFTNDGAAVGSGAFVLGVTASQSASAVMAYARERGVRRVVLVAGPEAWGRQAVAAATASGAAAGLSVAELPLEVAAGAGAALFERLSAAGGPPDAVLLADLRPALIGPARQLTESGVQLLGTSAWADRPAEALAAAEGAWFAAADTGAAADFAGAYRARHAAEPGALAVLAYDAAGLAGALSATGRPARAGLTDPRGLPAVTGPLRFEENGRCIRRLAVFAVRGGVAVVVDRRVAT